MDPIEALSTQLADRIAAAAPIVVGIQTARRPISGILWRPDVVVTSEQSLPKDTSGLQVVRGGQTIAATLGGRDPTTNVAALKLATPLQATLPPADTALRVGNLVLVAGGDNGGNPTARLAMVHALGDAWNSMAGGRIDALIRLDTRLGVDEGGPVLSLTGGLVGMSTSGPRRRTIVIPTATIARVLDPLLAEGRIAKGWLGVGLQPVRIPDTLKQAAGQDMGLIVVALSSGGPAETAGILPGDILLALDGTMFNQRGALSTALGADRVGQTATLRLLRGGAAQTLTVTIGAKPTQ